MRNIVYDKNEQTKRWLEWLGFSLGDVFELNGEDFRPYWRH